MANVDVRMSLSVYDGVGGGGTFITHAVAPEAGTFTNAIAALAALKTAYQTVGSGGIKEATFSIVDKALASSPSVATSTGYGGVFDFAAGVPATTYGLFVPAFLPSLVLPNGTIDISAGVPAAFVTTLLGAVLGGTYTNAAYAPLSSGLDAFSTNRKRIKRIRV